MITLPTPAKRPAFILAALTLIGAALRIGGLFGPLSHDELSAICRLQFDSLSALLDYGVKPDGHPGGVQVFLWLWSQMFGTSAIAIRLPFMLMAIATVPLIYSIGRRWYGRWSALLPTAVIAVSQYTVYYSDIARPYCVGLFFILCVLYVLTRMVSEQRFTLWRLATFALFEACCAYTHYFCALTATLMALAAFFFVGRRHVWSYLASCLGAVILFLPHLSITLYQLLELKGIGGWLCAPTPVFALEYTRYLTHHSLLAAAVVLIVFGLLFSLQTAHKNIRLLVASLSVGLLPAIIGYIYSVTVNPVLQYSVLIFSFPFLLLALAACVDDQRHVRHTTAVAVYVTVMVTTLFITRHHYDMLGHEWIEASVHEAQEANHEYGRDNVAYLFNFSPCMIAYYDSTIYPLPQEWASDATRLDSALSRCPQPYIVCSGFQDPAMLAVVNRHYPTLLRVRPCTVSEICLFSRQPSEKAICIDSLAMDIIERPLQASTDEFSIILDTMLGDIVDSRFVCIESALLFQDSAWTTKSKAIHLVTELVNGDHQLDWREVVLVPTERGSIQRVLLPVRIECFVKHRSQLRHSRIKIYLWNPDGNTHTIPLSFRIRILPTSPWMYSCLEEI